MKKRLLKTLIILCIAVIVGGILSGCFIRTPDDYYGSGGDNNGSGDEGEAVSITFSVSCINILSNFDKLDPVLNEGGFIPDDGIIIEEQAVITTKGKSVLAVLVDVAKTQRVAVSASLGYVQSIAHIAEFSCGKNSGWLFLVNGQRASVGATSAKVKEGDKIEWKYTVNLGDVA